MITKIAGEKGCVRIEVNVEDSKKLSIHDLEDVLHDRSKCILKYARELNVDYQSGLSMVTKIAVEKDGVRIALNLEDKKLFKLSNSKIESIIIAAELEDALNDVSKFIYRALPECFKTD
jgi:hypothetical protein